MRMKPGAERKQVHQRMASAMNQHDEAAGDSTEPCTRGREAVRCTRARLSSSQAARNKYGEHPDERRTRVPCGGLASNDEANKAALAQRVRPAKMKDTMTEGAEEAGGMAAVGDEPVVSKGAARRPAPEQATSTGSTRPNQ